MDYNVERTVALFKKAYFGTITPGERQELEELLRDDHLRAVYGEWIRHELLKEGIEMERLFPYGPAYLEFKRRVGHRHRFRVPVAAAILLLLLTPLYLLWPEAAGELPEAETPVLAPGHSQATIRLASGDIIAVADHAVRVEEGDGTSITYEDGRITYHAAETTGEPLLNELHVPVGGESHIVFDDGTRAWVNADTRLIYPVKFSGKERTVRVEGEAYFEVEPGERPFVVHTSLGDVTALGTSFAVRAYPAEAMAATLVSGKIRYTGSATLDLLPAEQVVVTPDGEVARRAVDVREYTGWRDGLFIFNKRALEAIMADLSRWYAFTVSYESDSLRNIPFSGHLKRYDNVNTFLDLLDATGELRYTIQDKHITLYAR
jgi:hypothetical protein